MFSRRSEVLLLLRFEKVFKWTFNELSNIRDAPTTEDNRRTISVRHSVFAILDIHPPMLSQST